MDWFRQIPIGQYVYGTSCWLRFLDPRLKFFWVLMFLLTPVLAGSIWRVGLVIGLLFITFISALPLRVWWRSLSFLIILAAIVGLLSMLLPTGVDSAPISVRSPQELKDATLVSIPWEILHIEPLDIGPTSIGPIIINRRSAELGLKTSTLIFTVVHSVNLMLLTTSPEDLMWSIRWIFAPLNLLGIPLDKISLQLLLALRFLPLVQEEFQNLLRSIAIRAVNFKELGFKASLGVFLSVAERFLANILLRAEQGADALLARGGLWLHPGDLEPKNLINRKFSWLNMGSLSLLVFVLCLRGKYGDL